MKNKKKWYIFYDNMINRWYLAKDGFRHNHYAYKNEAIKMRDKFNKEGV
jgi:hypothetical protein